MCDLQLSSNHISCLALALELDALDYLEDVHQCPALLFTRFNKSLQT